MKLEFLGCGTSNGVPMIGCVCKVCTSDDCRNKRTRSSIIVRSETTSILIDTTPEFRIQALRAGIRKLDAVFYTHTHADHLHGIDDLRALSYKEPLDAYASPDDIASILRRFDYLEKPAVHSGGRPRINFRPLTAPEIAVNDLRIKVIPIMHGKRRINGFRIGNMAYLTDCSTIPETSYPLLEGLEILIIDALRYRKHPTHFSLDEALLEIDKIKAESNYLTHMTHDFDYNELQRNLPSGVFPAHDGLSITFS